MREKHLFKRANKNISLRRIINDEKNREDIIKSLHDELNHKRKKKIYKKIANRY